MDVVRLLLKGKDSEILNEQNVYFYNNWLNLLYLFAVTKKHNSQAANK
jgi:hypothetical protein